MRIPYVEPIFFAPDSLPQRALTNDKKTKKFEALAAEYTGAKYAVATSSGTIALYITYRALCLRLKNIAMPAYTWRSTAEAAHMANAMPVFVDIDESFCLDGGKIAGKVGAICVVDCFGCPADYDQLLAICGKQSIPLIVDSAHSFGAKYKSNKIGQYGVHCYSFSPTKVIVANEGGLVTCNDSNLAEELISLRRWAGRMTEFNAACALEGLKRLPFTLEKKAEIANGYRTFALDHGFVTQNIPAHCRSTHKDVAIVCNGGQERDALKRHLEAAGIETKVYFLPANRLIMGPFAQGNLRITEKIYQQSLCLPSWPGADQSYILGKIDNFSRKRLCRVGKQPRTNISTESEILPLFSKAAFS